MTYQELLAQVFKGQLQFTCQNDLIYGTAVYQGQIFAICGVVNAAGLDNVMSINLARFILEVVKDHPQRPICLFIDSSGQKVSHHAELLALNHCYGHLIQTFNLARNNGHKIFALIYGQALGGALIATGLNADYIYALKEASIAVMWLEAMARVTKISLEKLNQLAADSVIFAPGVANYVRLGAIEELIPATEFIPRCLQHLNSRVDLGRWRRNGAINGSRRLAQEIVTTIVEHAAATP